MVMQRLTFQIYLSLCLYLFVFFSDARSEDEAEYYKIVSVATSQANTESRSKNWKPAPDDLVLEVSGMAALDDGRLALPSAKGKSGFWMVSTRILLRMSLIIDLQRHCTSH